MDNLDESLLTKNNLELNLDKWTNGTILYITGISGSGKTTLAKKIATESDAEYLELDIFCMFAKMPKDKCVQNLTKAVKDFYHLDDTFYYNFLENYVKNLPDTDFNYICSTKDLSNESFTMISNNAFNFIKAAEDFLSKNKINSKYIFEGCQIALMDSGYFKDKPLIVKNTGFIKSVYRATSRTIKNSSSFDKMLKSVFARLTPGSLKSLHRLDKIKDNFVDLLNESDIEESDIKMKENLSLVETASIDGTKIYLVRHGKTTWNALSTEEKKKQAQEIGNLNIQGIDTSKMGRDQEEYVSAEGMSEVRKTADSLKDVNFDVCICSPFVRTKQTADEILKYHKSTKIVYDPRVEELDFRNSVLTKDEVLYLDKIGWPKEPGKSYFWFLPDHGKRAFSKIADDANSLFADIKKKYKNKTVLIVSHGARIKSLLLYLNNQKINANNFEKVPKVPNASVNMKLLEEYQLFESRLPQDGSDPEFGLPDKKKFPLYDEAHVKSAIKFFNYAEGEDKIKLAKAIKTKMNKYGISYDTVGDDNNLKQYLTEFYNYILTEVKVNIDNIKNKVQPRPGETSASYTNRLNQQIYCVKKSKEHKQKQLAAQAAKNTNTDDRNIHKDSIKPGNPENQDYTIEEIDDDRTYGNIKSMNESVLDPINKERCKDLFKNDKMIPSARKFILDILADFKRQVNFPFEVKNIYMIGSSTGFQYSATSDIDIEVETNIPKNKMRQIINIIPKGTFLPNTQKPINLFVLEDGNSYNFDYAENVYDVKGNKWLKQTEKSNHNIPYQYIKDLSQFFMNGCDLTLSKFNQDKKEIQEYMGLDPKVQEISEKEKAEAIDRKINDIKNDIDAITMAHHVIFSFEQEGYNDMPFRLRIDMDKNDDPRYSVNNLVYKMIDRFGYLDKLNDAKKEAINIVKEAEKHVN